MSEHLLCCIDRVEPRGDGSVGVVVDGWCLASLPVESLWIATPDRARHPVSQGRPRADVGDAYPGYPDAADAGIAFQLPVAADEVTFGVTVKSPFGRTRTAETTLFLEPGRVQRLDILPARPPPSDIEGELVRCLDRGRGLMLRLDLVNRCNLRCVMCHHSDPAVRARPRGEIGLAGFQEIFASVAPWIREVMLSCADEPLVAREFAEVVAYLSGFPAVAVSFCTNGMLLDERVQRMVVSSGVARIVVSLDGVSRATVERIRAGANFDRIVANLLALRALEAAAGSPLPEVVLDFVMMASNLHEAPAFVRLAAAVGARSVDYRHVIPSEYFSDPGELLANHPERFNRAREAILVEGRRLGVGIVIPPPLSGRGTSGDEAEPAADLADLERIEAESAAARRIAAPGRPVAPARKIPDFLPGPAERRFARAFCPRPFSEITIVDQSSVKPCPFYRFALARLADGRPLRDVFLGEEFRALRRNMFRPQGDRGCLGCPWRADFLASRERRPDGLVRRTARRAARVLGIR